jgi:hypothetical protein
MDTLIIAGLFATLFLGGLLAMTTGVATVNINNLRCLSIVRLIFYSWVLKVILYQHITRCKKSLGTTVAAL